MSIAPILENQADEGVKSEYKKIKEALDLPYVPLFFTYIGGFPEYLNYLTNQIVPNLTDTQFMDLIQASEEIHNWLDRYRNSPAFYNFQKDLAKIFTVNIKLAFVFVVLREALKGWAVGAKNM